MATTSFVPFHTQDREWDARFNVPTQVELDMLLAAIKQEDHAGKFRYVMVSGIEIGTRPYQPDFQIKHVHCCLVYNNRVTKSSVLKNLKIKEGNGYYLVPRNKTLPYHGWVTHHKKLETKICQDILSLYETGCLPAEKPEMHTAPMKRSDLEKKRKLDDIIIEMKDLIDAGKDKEAFSKFPRNYLTYGEKLKAMSEQKRDFFKSDGHPHIWLYGLPGTGKSAILQVVYPDYFNKNMDNKFWDRYDPNVHSHVLCQDVDHQIIERLGVQFFKSICDEAGYPIDQKYKAPQIMRLCVLVSSNFTINEVMPEDMLGRSVNLSAIQRRFFQVNVKDLLPVLGIKMLSKYEITALKRDGNTDPTKIFMSWDYLRNCPTGEALQDPTYYQELIKAKYYGNAVSPKSTAEVEELKE